MHRLSRYIAFALAKGDQNGEDNADIYAYALEALFSFLANIAVCMVIAFAMGESAAGLVLLVCFMSIRRYAGGYHARSHSQCIFRFSLAFTVAMALVRFFPAMLEMPFIIGVGGASSTVLLLFSPVADGCVSRDRKLKCACVTLALLAICFLSVRYSRVRQLSAVALSMALAAGSVVCVRFGKHRRLKPGRTEI
jgi:accessory gene regulator B